MAYQISPMPMTLRDLEGDLKVTSADQNLLTPVNLEM